MQITRLTACLFALILQPISAQTFADKLGPAIGASVPPFDAPDQTGRIRQLKSLSGPKGTILLFIRSADW